MLRSVSMPTRSKTVWFRSWVRVRCCSCNEVMFRPKQWFGQRGWEFLTCPFCNTNTYAVLPPADRVVDWPKCMDLEVHLARRS